MQLSPFMQFWNAINERLHEQHLPQLRFHDAFIVWQRSVGLAQQASMQAKRSE